MDTIGPDMLARLLAQYGPALVLYARQWCRWPEDVVQEAFLELMAQTRAPEQPVKWLYRVVRNGALDQSRSAQRRQRRESAAAHRGEPWFLPSTDQRLDAAEATRSLEGLPIDQRETIVARLWGGLSFDEIAELTGTSTSTAHRRYQAGLATLRERLENPCTPTNNPT